MFDCLFTGYRFRPILMRAARLLTPVAPSGNYQLVLVASGRMTNLPLERIE